MRVLCLFSLSVLFAGCGQQESHEQQRAALDALLTDGHVKRVEFVDRQHDKTNVLVAERALDALVMFSATNRVEMPPPDTKHYSDWIFLFRDDVAVRLEYYPRQQVLSYRGYRFALRSTNDIHRFFE
jgi:hypothetical protein